MGGGGQGGSLVDGAGSYSIARAGLLPTELTSMWGWILLRPPHQGRGSPPAPAPTKQRPGRGKVFQETEGEKFATSKNPEACCYLLVGSAWLLILPGGF